MMREQRELLLLELLIMTGEIKKLHSSSPSYENKLFL